MRARLRQKAGANGLDEAAYVRMLIYRDLNGIAHEEAGQHGAVGSRHLHAAPVNFDARETEEPEPLPVEEMDIPADADGGEPGAGLDELLGAGPSLLDEMLAMAAPQPSPQMPAPARVPQRGYRPAYQRRMGVQPSAGPGSLTRAVGVNDQSIGANNLGDGHGNVLRDNMRHFGIVGTRSR